MNYSPARFRIVQRLTRECFDYHPVWSEYYDFEERDEIASWGIDRAWLDARLLELPDHPHPHYTVLDTDPIPARMRIFIKADFTTPKGRTLTGWVINEDAFVIDIFVGEQEFTFNPNLPQHVIQRTQALKEALGDIEDPIFPIQYTTDYFTDDRQPICGIFAPFPSTE